MVSVATSFCLLGLVRLAFVMVACVWLGCMYRCRICTRYLLQPCHVARVSVPYAIAGIGALVMRSALHMGCRRIGTAGAGSWMGYRVTARRYRYSGLRCLYPSCTVLRMGIGHVVA